MKAIQKISLIILLVMLFMSCCATASALEATWKDFDSTYVLDDLKNSTIAGENFDPDDYDYTDERELKVLSFVEYGFGVNDTSHYGLYVYVYNPTGVAIQDVVSNKVTVATTYNTKGEATDYEKFELQILSASEGKYAYLFYKFKLKDSSKLLTRVQVNANKRRYDVSEIELRFAGATTAKAFEVANYWEYTGYAKGLGADTEAESTLACTSDRIDVLKLDVHSTYYRYNNGVNTQANMSSVYFGVPNYIFEKYGKLQQIKANWFETRTEQMLVLSDKKLAEALYPYAGLNMQANSFDLSKLPNDANHVYKRLYGGEIQNYGESWYFGFVFDGEYHKDPDYQWNRNRGDRYYNQLDWILYSENGLVTSQELLSYATDYTSKIGGKLLIDKYSTSLFVAEVDNGRQYGWQGFDGQGEVFDADALFNINGFTTGNKLKDWWTGLFYEDLETTPLKDIEPIYLVKSTDLTDISPKLYVADEDTDEFLDVYMQNTLEGKKTVLFRFAVTDYTANGLSGYRSLVTSDNVGYVAQQTVFLDFDIIWLKFVDNGVETVIPTVSNPVDIFSGTTPPLEETPFPDLKGARDRLLEKILAFIKKYWWTIPVGIAGITLVITIAQFGLTAVLNGLWWLIKSPFKLIAKLFKRSKR